MMHNGKFHSIQNGIRLVDLFRNLHILDIIHTDALYEYQDYCKDFNWWEDKALLDLAVESLNKTHFIQKDFIHIIEDKYICFDYTSDEGIVYLTIGVIIGGKLYPLIEYFSCDEYKDKFKKLVDFFNHKL